MAVLDSLTTFFWGINNITLNFISIDSLCRFIDGPIELPFDLIAKVLSWLEVDSSIIYRIKLIIGQFYDSFSFNGALSISQLNMVSQLSYSSSEILSNPRIFQVNIYSPSNWLSNWP